jgi:acyl carrier protein
LFPQPEDALLGESRTTHCRRNQETIFCQEGEIMPDREFIRQTLIELLEADTGEKYPDLNDDVNLREGLGLDSVDVVSVVSQVERRFRIRLTHQELEGLVKVGDVLTLLEGKLAGGTGAEPSAA